MVSLLMPYIPYKSVINNFLMFDVLTMQKTSVIPRDFYREGVGSILVIYRRGLGSILVIIIYPDHTQHRYVLIKDFVTMVYMIYL